MATITKRLCIPVGAYKDGSGNEKIEYREIGFEIEFEGKDGSRWTELKINVDMLNPVLFQLVRAGMDKGSSMARVKKFDVARKQKVTPEGGTAPDDDDQDPY